MKYTSLLFTLFAVVLLGCSTSSENDDWIWLFDGSTTDGWRGFNNKMLPEGWSIEEGTLKSMGTGGDIIYAAQEFENFELYLEWKISEGGNSGIFYHVMEGDKYHAAYENAPEYQLIDDLGYPDPIEPWQQVAADYAMYPAANTKPVKPAGEWNSSRIIFTNEKAQYFLNGKKVVEFVPWSDDWNARREAGKWADFEDYGKAKKGYIGLQEHPGQVWFRNIKIRVL